MKKTLLLALLAFCFTPFAIGQEIPAAAPAADVPTEISTSPAPAPEPPAPAVENPAVAVSTEPAQAETQNPVPAPAISTGTLAAPPAAPPDASTGTAVSPAGEIAVSTEVPTLPGMEPLAPAPAPGADAVGKGPWEPAEIAVKGNINVKPKVITRTGKAKKGKLYYADFINSDIEAILGLGSIEKVSVDIAELPGRPVAEKFMSLAGSSDTVRITYIVAEKYMIKGIAVKGHKKLSKGAVKDEMSLKEKDFFDELRIREDLIKITGKYHDKGFIEAAADYESRIDTAAHTCYLTINVKEGLKARIAEVAIDGLKDFPAKKIVKKMKNRPKKIYAPQDFANDLKEIADFYRNSGYSEFKIDSASVTFKDDKSRVFVRLAVTEGPRRRFGATSFSGNTVYMSKDLGEAVEYKRGKLFSQEKLDDTIRGLQDKYADKGYLKARLMPEKVPNASTGELDLVFNIVENDPIYVSHIDVEGNKNTKTYVLRREIVQKEGAVFSSSKIRRSQEKLMNLGFLDDVGIAVNPTPEPDKVDLVFDIVEGKPGMLTAGAGVSSRDGLVGTMSLQHLNFLGRAYRTSLAWNFGKRVQDYSLSWTTPWIGEHPTSLGVDIFNTRRFRPYRNSLSAYTERRTGGKVTLGPRFEDDKYRLITAYTLENVRISGVEQIYSGELIEGTSVTSSVYVEFARDTRDNIWDPTRGSKSSIGLEFTGGPFLGDVNYYKPTLSHSYNLKLFSIDDYPFVLAISNKLGFGAGFGKTPRLPVYEKYFLGGADTIRGYNNGQIGPVDGGKVYDILNLEFHFPLARERKHTIVQWAFFLDIGNSWQRFNNVSLRSGTGANDLKIGAGFGIRFTTPAFPIRLDWGYGFNHKPGEQRSDIYFTLGNLF
ncbi:MAG: outer membrane protein assembly factor BamA [Elusimicrobia bacterium]|nr:outer membrane protein assembly factor BamA [Elusimicrobiota bacterium]